MDKLWKCEECGSINKEKKDKCEGCSESEFIEIDKEDLSIEDIVCLIRDYYYREDVSNDVAEYWDVFEYIEEYIGEKVYSNFDKALKLAEERNIAIKKELIYFPE